MSAHTLGTSKVLLKSPAMSSFYETESDIWAILGRWGSFEFMNILYIFSIYLLKYYSYFE
jgi:hypothetical protein